MMLGIFALLFLSISISASNYFSTVIEPHGVACFFETLALQDRLDMSFEVAAGGNLDIDFWITSPASKIVHSGIATKG